MPLPPSSRNPTARRGRRDRLLRLLIATACAVMLTISFVTLGRGEASSARAARVSQVKPVTRLNEQLSSSAAPESPTPPPSPGEDVSETPQQEAAGPPDEVPATDANRGEASATADGSTGLEVDTLDDLDAYYMREGTEWLTPEDATVTDDLEITVLQPTAGLQNQWMFGPKNAFDRSLDTAVETDEETPSFEIQFRKPVSIGRIGRRKDGSSPADHLSGIRMLDRHRQAGRNLFSAPLFVVIFTNNNSPALQLQKPKTLTAAYLLKFDEVIHGVTRIMLFKPPMDSGEGTGGLTFSELEFYSDTRCERHRKVTVLDAVGPTVTKGSPPLLVSLLTNVTSPCSDSRALSPELGMGYSVCGQPSRAAVNGAASGEHSCAAYVLTIGGSPVVDGTFLASMNKAGCQPVAVGPVEPRSSRAESAGFSRYAQATWCAEDGCNNFEAFADAVGGDAHGDMHGPPVSKADVIYVESTDDLTQKRWPLLDVLLNVTADTLMLPLRVSVPLLLSQEALGHVARLLSVYAVRSVHVNTAEGVVAFENVIIPREFHVTLAPCSPRGACPHKLLRDGVLRSGISLAERFASWTNGLALTAANVPLTDTGQIPARLFGSWKTKTLGAQALLYWDNFRAHEPQLEPIIVDDAECAELADLYPNLRKRYDSLPLSVMRADVCRVLAVYFFGGYYKDLDIDWRRPLKEWIDTSDAIAYGWEDDEHVCQWFFAARPGNRCVRNILQQISNLIVDSEAIDFNKNVEAVIDITGPGVWTDALQGCAVPPKYSVTMMKTENIYHAYGSQNWASKNGYVSWIEERQKHAGWDRVWPLANLEAYLRMPASEALHPVFKPSSLGSSSPLRISVVQSSVMFGLDDVFGPRNAFDRRTDTWLSTQDFDDSHIDIKFNDGPMSIGTVYPTDGDEAATGGPRHLACVRIFNRQRNPGSEFWMRGHGISLFSDEMSAEPFFTTRKEGRHVSQFLFTFGGMPANVSGLRIFSRSQGLSVSEIELYSDIQCSRTVAVDVVEYSVAAPTIMDIETLRLLTTRSNPKEIGCANPRSLSLSADGQFALCERVKLPETGCNAVVLTLSPTWIPDKELLQSLDRLTCRLAIIGAAPSDLSLTQQAHYAKGAGGGAPLRALIRDTLERDAFNRQKAGPSNDDAPLPPIAVLYMGLRPEDLVLEHNSPMSVALEAKAQTLLLRVELSNLVTSGEAVRQVQRLLEDYAVAAVVVEEGVAIAVVNDLPLPGALQVTLVRKDREGG